VEKVNVYTREFMAQYAAEFAVVKDGMDGAFDERFDNEWIARATVDLMNGGKPENYQQRFAQMQLQLAGFLPR